MEEAKTVTVSEVQLLLKKKDEIEAQIKAYYEVLEDQKNVGMNEPLVDVEGYPRADVDIYQVRTARHNIICLQNDHKELMEQIEQALHQLHAREKEKRERDEAEARVEARSQREAVPEPFAKVNAVTPGSPASFSGLQVDDEIAEFGSVNAHNFRALQDIATVVQHSEGVSRRIFRLQPPPFAKMISSVKAPNKQPEWQIQNLEDLRPMDEEVYIVTNGFSMKPGVYRAWSALLPFSP